MARIIVDSDVLESHLCLLGFICTTLEQCTDEEDLDVVEDCTMDIQRTTDNLRQIIKNAEPVEEVQP